jgi:hypothetical protein
MILVWAMMLGIFAVPVFGEIQEELPDDYLPFVMVQLDDRLEGKSEFLEGFTITMDIQRQRLAEGLSKEALFSVVRGGDIKGTVTYPNGKITEIKYEIVRHRGYEDIYMKSSLGYFLWEYMSVRDGKLQLAIYWWYTPPATQTDIEILIMAESLLADPDRWHQKDDRRCDHDAEDNRWSLFCALKHASLVKAGEYNHHNTAVQTVRFVIDDLKPGHEYPHTLMDYNNDTSTRHEDILHVLAQAKQRIGKELTESSN